MRLRVVLLLVGAALLLSGPALAQSQERPQLPGLPGMKLAEDATRAEVAPSKVSRHGGSEPSPSPTPTTAREAAVPDHAPIVQLPGAGPVVDQLDAGLTSSRSEAGGNTTPRGLAALAALGTIVSVGSFLLLRDRILSR